MATYLAICQKVAAESGTISGTQPTTTIGQTGRLLKLVNWVADAWTEIQNRHASWEWMIKPLPATALALVGSPRYTAASWGITDFGEWIRDPHAVSIYSQALGVADEGEIDNIAWIDFWRIYTRGVQTPTRPSFYSISPQEEFCLAATPDQNYQVRGLYRSTAQTLAVDTDVPNCPARFHDAIVWLAVRRLCEHDEAPQAAQAAQVKYLEQISGLERDQLPPWEAYVTPLA